MNVHSIVHFLCASFVSIGLCLGCQVQRESGLWGAYMAAAYMCPGATFTNLKAAHKYAPDRFWRAVGYA